MFFINILPIINFKKITRTKTDFLSSGYHGYGDDCF